LVLEAYFNGGDADKPRDIRSVAKTITGTLVGIAHHEGQLDSLDNPILTLFPNVPESAKDSKRVKITTRHLLEMRSGFDADDWWENPNSAGTETRMEAATDRLSFALKLPLSTFPGTRWQYSNVNTMLLGRVVSAVTKRDLLDYAEEKLFGPLGFGPHHWRRDPQGNVVAQGNLSLRSRDLLKFGLLFQQGGRWNGRQLVPKSWIDKATRPHGALPRDPTTGLGDMFQGYGLHWWTAEVSTASSKHSFYFASGNGGQRVVVVPSLDLVVVVTSAAYNRGYAHRRAHRILTRIIAAAEADAR
jgi:CubicO group peptidase (beta-lactamase class C family)